MAGKSREMERISSDFHISMEEIFKKGACEL